MSSRIEPFECHWQASSRLLWAYLGIQGLAILAILLSGLPWPLAGLGLLICTLHAAWVLPRQLLLSQPTAARGIRHNPSGWQLWSAAAGWQPVQLAADSLALPGLILLRFRRPGDYWTRSLCIPADALAAEVHRRLRVRLRFSRNRWAAAE